MAERGTDLFPINSQYIPTHTLQLLVLLLKTIYKESNMKRKEVIQLLFRISQNCSSASTYHCLQVGSSTRLSKGNVLHHRRNHWSHPSQWPTPCLHQICSVSQSQPTSKMIALHEKLNAQDTQLLLEWRKFRMSLGSRKPSDRPEVLKLRHYNTLAWGHLPLPL